MFLSEILVVSRIAVEVRDKPWTDGDQVLHKLSELLSVDGVPCHSADVIYRRLSEREQLQSTGIGDGVAIPHTNVEEVTSQRAALVLCPSGVEFAAIDQKPVHIFLGVIGPKNEASAHLKILAKISRLLRSQETRRRLLESASPEQAYSLIEEHERSSLTS